MSRQIEAPVLSPHVARERLPIELVERRAPRHFEVAAESAELLVRARARDAGVKRRRLADVAGTADQRSRAVFERNARVAFAALVGAAGPCACSVAVADQTHGAVGRETAARSFTEPALPGSDQLSAHALVSATQVDGAFVVSCARSARAACDVRLLDRDAGALATIQSRLTVRDPPARIAHERKADRHRILRGAPEHQNDPQPPHSRNSQPNSMSTYSVSTFSKIRSRSKNCDGSPRWNSRPALRRMRYIRM
jgi:hypothetical protein